MVDAYQLNQISTPFILRISQATAIFIDLLHGFWSETYFLHINNGT